MRCSWQFLQIGTLPKKQDENFKKIREELRNFEEKIGERLRKDVRKFYIKFGESVEKIQS